MKRKIIMNVSIIVAACCLLGGCAPKTTGKNFMDYEYFNTVSTMVVTDIFDAVTTLRAESCWKDVKAELAEAERLISLDGEESNVKKFNQAESGATIAVDKEFYSLLAKTADLYILTEGAFNPASGLLVDLWGFSPRFNAKDGFVAEKPYDRTDWKNQLPDQKYIDAFLSLTDYSKISFWEKDGQYFVKKPDMSVEIDETIYTMQIDFGGIGKGYAADRARNAFVANGYGNGYISIGRSSIYVAKNQLPKMGEGDKWNLELVHPRTETNYVSLLIADTTVSTSGDYQQYFEADGRRYSHIIDTATGMPIDNGMMSATVVCDNAAQGDALSTALCVMGAKKAAAFLHANRETFTGIFLYGDGTNLYYYSTLTSGTVIDGILPYTG